MHNWEAYIPFIRTAFFSSMAYAFFSQGHYWQGGKGHAGILVKSFFEVRGEEGEEWRARMKGGMMKGQKCSHEMERKRKRLLVQVPVWSIHFFWRVDHSVDNKVKRKALKKWKICYNLQQSHNSQHDTIWGMFLLFISMQHSDVSS